jgi:hypothetical protein
MDFQTHLFLGAWHDSPAFGTTANPGVGLLVREGDFLAGAGAWRNSLKETAPYAFGGYQPFRAGQLRAGGALGATKYRDKPTAIGGALFTYTHQGTEWHVLVTPKVKDLAPTTVMLSASF